MASSPEPSLSADHASDEEIHNAVSFMLGSLKGCSHINIVQGDPGRYILRFQLMQGYDGGHEALQEDILAMLEPVAPSARPYQFGSQMIVAAVETQDVKKLASANARLNPH